jgi:hypothetical protein
MHFLNVTLPRAMLSQRSGTNRQAPGMRRQLMVFALAVIAIMMAIGSAAQAAVYYPWCAYWGVVDSDARNCGFVNWTQCMDTVRGNGGFCEPNPAYFARCRSNCGDSYSQKAVRAPINAPD